MGPDDFKIILIGSSTGALPVIEQLLNGVKREFFSIVIAQHMPESYTGMWAERLNNHTPFDVMEGFEGAEILPQKAFIAPGNRHMRVMYNSNTYKIAITDEPPVKRFKPSVDVLFSSVFGFEPSLFIPVILTGMCDDGVDSIVDLHKKGFTTIAQNKETSVVYGMNKEAIERGGIDMVFSPDEMVAYFNSLF